MCWFDLVSTSPVDPTYTIFESSLRTYLPFPNTPSIICPAFSCPNVLPIDSTSSVFVPFPIPDHKQIDYLISYQLNLFLDVELVHQKILNTGLTIAYLYLNCFLICFLFFTSQNLLLLSQYLHLYFIFLFSIFTYIYIWKINLLTLTTFCERIWQFILRSSSSHY